MDSARRSVGLRGYGVKDPLVEYKTEGFEIFLEMMINIRRDVIYSVCNFSRSYSVQPLGVDGCKTS